MIPLDMDEIPSRGRITFAWLDKFVVDCLGCGRRLQSRDVRIFHQCPRCGSTNVRPVKKTRIPYRTLTQARDEGRLLVYPQNPTETNAQALADWRNNPRSIKRHALAQVKRGATTNETSKQTRPSGELATRPL